MELQELKKLLSKSWEKDIYLKSLKEEWNKDSSSLVKCAVTSLIVNDIFGGKIISSLKHYYNLVDGRIIDLTRDQISDGFDKGKEINREQLLENKNIKEIYERLLNNLKQLIEEKQNKKYKLLGRDGQEYLSDTKGQLGGNKRLKIYGRLDCPSANRWIAKGYYVPDRVFFENEEVAISLGYRPCAVCMPVEYKKWKNSQQRKIKK